MNIHFKTLGCRLNEAETESWARQFQANGHNIVLSSGKADLVVMNSCAVTSEAVRKSRRLIRRIHRENPKAKMVVSGCYATLNQQEVAETLGVDVVVNNTEKKNWLNLPTASWICQPCLSLQPNQVWEHCSAAAGNGPLSKSKTVAVIAVPTAS